MQQNLVYLNKPLMTWDTYPWRAGWLTVYWWEEPLGDLVAQGLLDIEQFNVMEPHLGALVRDYHDRYEASPDSPEFEDGYLPLYHQIDEYLAANLSAQAHEALQDGLREQDGVML